MSKRRVWHRTDYSKATYLRCSDGSRCRQLNERELVEFGEVVQAARDRLGSQVSERGTKLAELREAIERRHHDG